MWLGPSRGSFIPGASFLIPARTRLPGPGMKLTGAVTSSVGPPLKGGALATSFIPTSLSFMDARPSFVDTSMSLDRHAHELRRYIHER
jgi:hypothetical protein